ncbi:unnamed protein product [Lathyrus oleraceus]
MAKVHPQEQESTTSSQSHDDQCLNKRERYTVWMKSLVLHSNGCTVYDSNGNIVYRVDNYDTKGGREVNLMNLKGNVVCTIKKRLLAFGSWEGHNTTAAIPILEVKRSNHGFNCFFCFIMVGIF